MQYQSPFIDKWPTLSFEEIEHIEIEQKGIRIFYQSFFKILNLPESVLKAFVSVLKEGAGEERYKT